MSSQNKIFSIRMSKLESAHPEPWGFRLQGGIDVIAPLTVLKVNTGSLAEKAGLQVGDTLIQINGSDITHLFHKDAHDILSRAGNNFELVISRRDNGLDFSNQTPQLHQVMNSTAKPFKPFNTEQLNNDKNYNNGSSPVMKGQQETDEKSRARDLLMRKLAVFRSKTDPKTLHEVNVNYVKPNNDDYGLKPSIKNVLSDIKVEETLPFTPASDLTIKEKYSEPPIRINEQPKHVARIEQNPVSTTFYSTSKNLLVQSDSDDDLPPPVPSNPPPSSPPTERQQIKSPFLTTNTGTLSVESDSDESIVPPPVPTNPPPSSPLQRPQFKVFTGPKPFVSSQPQFRVPAYKPVYERMGVGAITTVKEKNISSQNFSNGSPVKPPRMKCNEQPSHPSNIEGLEITTEPLLNAITSDQPSDDVILLANEENVTTVQAAITASPIASPRTSLETAHSNNCFSSIVSGEDSAEAVVSQSSSNSRGILEDRNSFIQIQSTLKGNSTAAERIQTPPIASPRTNLTDAQQLDSPEDTDNDSVVIRSSKEGRKILEDRNSSARTSSSNSSSLLFDLNSSLDSEKDHQYEFDGNFYSNFPSTSFSSENGEKQSSSAVFDTSFKGSWPGMIDITCEDIEDLGPLDPELGLLDEEPKTWVNVVDNKLLEELSDKEVKRQEHIYEFIMSEKNHCIALIVIQNIFSKRMRREGFTPETVDKIFPSCLKHLIDYHLNFLHQLRQRQRQHPIVYTIEDILCDQFSDSKGDELRLLYTDFCNRQQVSIAKFKEMVSVDSKFASFAEKCALNPLCKKSIITCTLYVAQRLTRYPLLIEPLIKMSNNDPPNEELRLNQALAFVKKILLAVNAKIAEKELKMRRIALLDKIDQKSQTNYQGKKFRKLDLISNKRRLMFEGVAYLQQGRSKAQLVTVVVLSDIIIFMYESNQKLYFLPAQDNKSGILPLPNLLVREKAGGQDAQSIYLISSNADEPELYELQCQTPRDKNTWISKISAAVEHCAKIKEASTKQKNDNSIDEQEDL